MQPRVAPTGVERKLGADEIVVSKTDLRGRITYANSVFLRMCACREREVLGRPHNLIRHPAMPRALFRLLWDTIKAGDEVFAYVLNLGLDGAHYWVFAHVTPSYDAAGAMVGYHSNRRAPHPAAVASITPLYQALIEEERRHRDPVEAIDAGTGLLHARLAEVGLTYDQFVWSLTPDLARR
ncbi:MAG: PAS domain-containing protein [Acidimicrobiia bacterium]